MSTTSAQCSQSAITLDQKNFFEQEGYLLLRGLLSEDTLAPLRACFENVVEQQASAWLKDGVIKDKCEGLPFETRLAALREQIPPTFSNSWRRILVSPALYEIWKTPELVSLARTLLDTDELWASAIWNGRPRVPKQPVQSIDWHQDAHYMANYEPEDGRSITIWFPLVPVDEAAGCLQVAPRSHLAGLRPQVVQKRNGLVGLEAKDLQGLKALSCEMNPGDVLVFTEKTYHRSLDNNSDRVRWSFDLRYADARNTRLVDKETRARELSGTGYKCFSASDPSSVTPYEQWAGTYTHQGEF